MGNLEIRDLRLKSQILRSLSLGEWSYLWKTKAVDVSFHVIILKSVGDTMRGYELEAASKTWMP